MRNKIKVTCAWGDGPDVLVTFNDKSFVLYENPKNDDPPKGQWKHGYVSIGSFNLTADEAEALSYKLKEAAQTARKLDRSYAKTMSNDT